MFCDNQHDLLNELEQTIGTGMFWSVNFIPLLLVKARKADTILEPLRRILDIGWDSFSFGSFGENTEGDMLCGTSGFWLSCNKGSQEGALLRFILDIGNNSTFERIVIVEEELWKPSGEE